VVVKPAPGTPTAPVPDLTARGASSLPGRTISEGLTAESLSVVGLVRCRKPGRDWPHEFVRHLGRDEEDGTPASSTRRVKRVLSFW